ncbi:hypothetical protein A9308_03960 [Moraxella atlantae]|uniref:Uncharacterized protein n=1 Tax=Faucicola atlantae TaxID=34059 RepID=A0A1B8QF34_9GAMM|nr:hypothetical protein [Moraxella atlantae]OBX80497.1 hypothetical protein A9308_03960 [Moraxella atlantae]
MKSLELWQSVNADRQWKEWLNKKGNDGTLIDTDDNVSFIDTETKKAVKITYEPNGKHEFEHWNSDFDSDEYKIDVLNIVFSNIEKAKSELPSILSNFNKN